VAERKKVDWEALEREFRIGSMSLRALCEKHGANPGNASRRAKKEGWVQDASQEVRERTRAALITQHKEEDNTVVFRDNAPTRADVDVAVQTNLAVITRHRRDIGQGQEIVGLLMRQLVETAVNRESIENDIEEETKGDETNQRRYRMIKAISLPTNAAVMRDLSTAMKNLVGLERQAFNLDELSSEETYEERLARLMGSKE
jgi:hypothetical protein